MFTLFEVLLKEARLKNACLSLEAVYTDNKYVLKTCFFSFPAVVRYNEQKRFKLCCLGV